MGPYDGQLRINSSDIMTSTVLQTQQWCVRTPKTHSLRRCPRQREGRKGACFLRSWDVRLAGVWPTVVWIGTPFWSRLWECGDIGL